MHAQYSKDQHVQVALMIFTEYMGMCVHVRAHVKPGSNKRAKSRLNLEIEISILENRSSLVNGNIRMRNPKTGSF